MATGFPCVLEFCRGAEIQKMANLLLLIKLRFRNFIVSHDTGMILRPQMGNVEVITDNKVRQSADRI